MLRLFAVLALLVFGSFAATVPVQADDEEGYRLLPGDRLQISVWREDLLNREVVVLPDGAITFPLAGRIMVEGSTTPQVEKELVERLGVYLADPVVTVAISEVAGNRVYLLGKVQAPGPVIMSAPTTLSQILSLAGGFDRFADLTEIRVLRGQGEGARYIRFNYDRLTSGRDPEAATMLLEPGDVIIVP